MRGDYNRVKVLTARPMLPQLPVESLLKVVIEIEK